MCNSYINQLLMKHPVCVIEYNSNIVVNNKNIRNTIYINDNERNVYVQLYYDNGFKFYNEYDKLPTKENSEHRWEYVNQIIDKLKI